MREFAGEEWCARFPTSRSTSDLLPDFRDKVECFNKTLMQGGARVTFNATYRPPERAYLMHWCCMIAKSGQDAAAIPAMADVDIDWTCGGDRGRSMKAAERMAIEYGIVFPAALVSRHTQRRAVDMTIENYVGKVFTKPGGDYVVLSTERDLWHMGALFDVIKLPSDSPHWSDDGH